MMPFKYESLIRFQISDWRDLIGHLHAIDASAKNMDGSDDELLEIAKDLQTLARHAIAFVEARDPKAQFAALDKRESVSLKRKATMLRLLLSGARTSEVARQFGVSDTAVLQNVHPVLFTLRKRSRLIARMSDKKDPLEQIGSATVAQMTPDQRFLCIECLDRYDLELERRAAGLPWDDVWRSWPK